MQAIKNNKEQDIQGVKKILFCFKLKIFHNYVQKHHQQHADI